MGDNLDLELEEIKERGKRKKKNRFELITTQSIICIVILLAALTMKTLGGNIYEQARQGYIETFEDQTRVEEVLETIGHSFEIGTGNAGSSFPSSEETQSSSEVSSDVTSSTSSDPAVRNNPEEDTASSVDAFGDDVPAADEKLTGTQYVATDSNGQTVVESIGEHINTLMLPVNGRISSEYGYRVNPITGIYKLHGGIDLGGYEGESIQAAMAGTAKTVDEDDSFGKYIVLEHVNGMETYYAHCSKIIVKEGQQVAKGDKIAEVGSTGISTGPHCHFEVRVNNTRINPLWLLSVNNT